MKARDAEEGMGKGMGKGMGRVWEGQWEGQWERRGTGGLCGCR